MDIDSAMAAIEEADGILAGPFRAPANLAADSAGSIHDDKTAQGLGFRGGTVAGSVHMQQFPPMLVRMFGPEWFEHGTISTYFRNATMHGERVRPFGRGKILIGQAAGRATQRESKRRYWSLFC